MVGAGAKQSSRGPALPRAVRVDHDARGCLGAFAASGLLKRRDEAFVALLRTALTAKGCSTSAPAARAFCNSAASRRSRPMAWPHSPPRRGHRRLDHRRRPRRSPTRRTAGPRQRERPRRRARETPARSSPEMYSPHTLRRGKGRLFHDGDRPSGARKRERRGRVPKARRRSRHGAFAISSNGFAPRPRRWLNRRARPFAKRPPRRRRPERGDLPAREARAHAHHRVVPRHVVAADHARAGARRSARTPSGAARRRRTGARAPRRGRASPRAAAARSDAGRGWPRSRRAARRAQPVEHVGIAAPSPPAPRSERRARGAVEEVLAIDEMRRDVGAARSVRDAARESAARPRRFRRMEPAKPVQASAWLELARDDPRVAHERVDAHEVAARALRARIVGGKLVEPLRFHARTAIRIRPRAAARRGS